MSGRLDPQSMLPARQGSMSLDLEGPRRWQTKHAEELKNMLPLRRLKGLGLHRNDSKFTELSTDDITQLVKEVMTFETSRRNAIQDSTESLKATVMDSAVSDFCHEQHVSTLLKRMQSRHSDPAFEQVQKEENLNELVSLLHITETAVTIIQTAFRNWRQRWHGMQPSERARIRSRYMQAVRKANTRRREAAAQAEAERQEAARRRREAQSRNGDASLWLEQALHQAEEATLQFSQDQEGSETYSRPQSIAPTPRMQSASAQRTVGFGRLIVSARPRRPPNLSISGTANPLQGEPSISPSHIPSPTHIPSPSRIPSPESYPPTPQIDNRDLSELTPMEKVRRVAQTILKATPQLEAQLHGRQAAPGSPTPGALMLRSLLHAGVGGLDLLGVSTAEELAERLKQEVARRVEELINSTPADREEDMPHLRRIQSLMQQAHAVVKASDEEMAEVQAAGDAVTEQLVGQSDEEAVAGQEQEAAEQQPAAAAAVEGAQAEHKAVKKAVGKGNGHAKPRASGSKSSARKAANRSGSAASSESDTAGSVRGGARKPAPSRLRARPPVAPPAMTRHTPSPPRYSPPGSPGQTSPGAPGSPRAGTAVRVLDLLRAGELDQWMARVSAHSVLLPRGARRGEPPGPWADSPAYVAAHSVESQEEQWLRQQEWERRQRERAEQAERERQVMEAHRQQQQLEVQLRRQRRTEEHRTRMEERMRQLHPNRGRVPTAAELENGRWFVNKGLHYIPVRATDAEGQELAADEQEQGSSEEPSDEDADAVGQQTYNPGDVFESGFPWSGHGLHARHSVHFGGPLSHSHSSFNGQQRSSDEDVEQLAGASRDPAPERTVGTAALAAVHSTVCLAVLLEMLGESGPAPSGVSQLPPLLEGMGLGYGSDADRLYALSHNNQLPPRRTRPLLTTKSGRQFARSSDTWSGLAGTVRGAWRSDGPTAPQPLVLTVEDEQLPPSFTLQGAARGSASLFPEDLAQRWQRSSRPTHGMLQGTSYAHPTALAPTRASRYVGARWLDAQAREGAGPSMGQRNSVPYVGTPPTSSEQTSSQQPTGPSLPLIDGSRSTASPLHAAFLGASSSAAPAPRPAWLTPEACPSPASGTAIRSATVASAAANAVATAVRPSSSLQAAAVPAVAAAPSVPAEAIACIEEDQLGLVTMFCLEHASKRSKLQPSTADPLARLSQRPRSTNSVITSDAGAGMPNAASGAPVTAALSSGEGQLAGDAERGTVRVRRRRATTMEGISMSEDTATPGACLPEAGGPTPMRQRQRRATVDISPSLHTMSSPIMQVLPPPPLLLRRLSNGVGQPPSARGGDTVHAVTTVFVPGSSTTAGLTTEGPVFPACHGGSTSGGTGVGVVAACQRAPQPAQVPKLHDWWGARRRRKQVASASIPG